ncbi:MAG: antitoxin YezG family protein [Dysgonamonadaceae bacterium]|jgi:uncharacterized protein (TIGR01741 family)|nr:antitoxin YezG family protein [Dysgonamonadaceae bacterium]
MGLFDKLFGKKPDNGKVANHNAEDGQSTKSVPEKTAETASLESTLSDFYRRAAERVNALIPVEWDIFYLSIEPTDEGGGVAYFFYKSAEAGDKLFLSHNLPKEHNVNQGDYLKAMWDLLVLAQDVRRSFADAGQAVWYTFYMTLTAQGKMNAEFGYTNWPQSDIPDYELMDYFIYKRIGKEYLEPEKWAKAEEIDAYAKSQGQ